MGPIIHGRCEQGEHKEAKKLSSYKIVWQVHDDKRYEAMPGYWPAQCQGTTVGSWMSALLRQGAMVPSGLKWACRQRQKQ